MFTFSVQTLAQNFNDSTHNVVLRLLKTNAYIISVKFLTIKKQFQFK